MSPDVETAVQITVNGAAVQARAGQLVIAACEQAGVHIPHFCYHPRMSPVGMCRMCIVDIDTGRGPSLQPSCMVSVSEGMVVDTLSEQTRKAQEGVLEFLLLNHPLDCPVCDKGGECPLQDQTMSYGPGESRLVEEKRHFEKPIEVSSLVYLDRERCILCDRCTRFADEVAGDPLITFQDRADRTQVNTFPELPFASHFSGNTVQICPVGALTAKPYRFKARPWDLQEVQSTYPNPMGDRVVVQASRDTVLRIQGEDSEAVNWGWLADRDRFSFEALTHQHRLHTPLVRGTSLGAADPDGGELVEATWSQALDTAAEAIGQALQRRGPTSVAVLGGARLTNEAQYAWARLAKGVIGTDNVDAQMDDGLPAELVLGLPRASIAEACTPGATVVLLGPDPKEELGTLYLRLRHAVANDGVTLIELTVAPTGLSSLATHRLRHRPGEAHVVAAALMARSDPEEESDVGGVPAEQVVAARAALAAAAGGPLTVMAGRPSLAETAAPTVEAVAALMSQDEARMLPLLRRGNIFGALDMGLSPGLLPGRTTLGGGGEHVASVWGSVPDILGLGTAGILNAAATGSIDVLILLGADPVADAPDPELAAAALHQAGTVIAVDQFPNASSVRADVVLPVTGFGESSGTHTNLEGRITALRQVVTPPGTVRPDWVIATELAHRLGTDLGYATPEDIWRELSYVAATHVGVSVADVDAEVDGVVVSGGDMTFAPQQKTGDVPLDAYSLRLVTMRHMYDLGTGTQHCGSLAGLAPGAVLRVHPLHLQRIGVEHGETVWVLSAVSRLKLPVAADPQVPRYTAVVALNQPGGDARRIIHTDPTVTVVRIERT